MYFDPLSFTVNYYVHFYLGENQVSVMKGLTALNGGNAVQWSHFCPAGEQLTEISERTLHLYSELHITFSVWIETKLSTSSCLMY